MRVRKRKSMQFYQILLDAEMQKIVVQMKDELEKIKEQLLNIL